MRSFYLFIYLFLSGASAMAQSRVYVTGIVQTVEKDALPGTTVTLFTGNPKLATVAVKTNEEGFFLVELPSVHRILVSRLGFLPFEKGLMQPGSGDTVRLGFIRLRREDPMALAAIVIKGEKKLVEQKVDRTVIHAEAMIGASSGSIMQLLEKTPGLMVEGNAVTLNGRGTAMIMIDGRPSYMSETDLAGYLKSLPANSVDKIELIPVPPAAYDASGASIVNIILKKNRMNGVSGSVAAGVNAGKYLRANTAGTFYYNHKGVQLMSNVSYGRDAGFSDNHNNRVLFDADGKAGAGITQENFSRFDAHTLGARLGLEYKVSPRTTLGAIGGIQLAPGSEKMDYTTVTQDDENIPVYEGYGNSRQQNRSNNHVFNLHGSHRFKKEEASLTVDVNHMQYNKKLALQVNSFAASRTEQLTYTTPTDISIYTAQIDYKYPITSATLFETGIKTTRISTENLFAQATIKEGNVLEGDQNDFMYHEQVGAFYASVAQKWKHWNAKIGLRGEQTGLRGSEPSTDVTQSPHWFKRSYFSVFPSAFLSYAMDSAQTKNLVMSASKRINRPGFQQLNPFLFKQDDYNYYGGNPNLKPQLNTHIDLKYQHKSFWGITAMYSSFRQIAFQSLRVEDSLFIRQPENIGRGLMMGISGNTNFSPLKWWRLNANVIVVRLYLKGETFGQPIRQELYTGRLSLLNQFRLSDAWKTEWTLKYNHRNLQGQTLEQPRYRVDMAAQYDFLSQRAQLRFFVDDIFHSWIVRGTTKNLQQSRVYYTTTTDTRLAGISLTLRFGTKNNKIIQHQATTNEENNRVQ